MSMVVTGATGFIGRHLLKRLSSDGLQVRALTRRSPPSDLQFPGVEWIVGDIGDAGTWKRLLQPGWTVFNLAYSVGTVVSDAIGTAERMADFCADGGARRLVHASTVSVYGQQRSEIVTEASECHPRSAYGAIKLGIEKALLDRIAGRLEYAILRPTNVFGAGGVALSKEVADIAAGSAVKSYFRATLFGRRRAHFVPVETVAAALLHLAELPLEKGGEVFIVSDDDEDANNFHDVNGIIRQEIGRPAVSIPQIVLPRTMLETLLKARGRPNSNTRVVYSPNKLLARGFARPIAFEQALRQHVRAEWSAPSAGSTR